MLLNDQRHVSIDKIRDIAYLSFNDRIQSVSLILITLFVEDIELESIVVGKQRYELATGRTDLGILFARSAS